MMKLILFFIFSFAITSVKGQVICIEQAIFTRNNDLPTIAVIGSKFALRDNQGRLILTDIDSIGKHSKQNVYIVKKKKKYGLYSLDGKETIPVQFDKIGRLFNQFWIVESNNKKGLYNIYAKKSLPTIYDDIIATGRFGADIIVKKDTLYGIFNLDFEAVLPIVYNNIRNKAGLMELKQNNEKSYFLSGKIIKKNILDGKTFSIHGEYASDSRRYFIFEENNKLGIMDDDGLTILKPKYAEIISKGVPHNNLSPNNVFFAKKGEKWGVIEISDKVIVPFQFSSIDFAYYRTDYLIVGMNGAKQFYDINKKIVLDNIQFDNYYIMEKYTRIEKGGHETLVDNNTLKLVFPFKYESVSCLNDFNCFSVKKDGKCGVVDGQDNVIIPLIYDNTIIFSCDNKAVAQKDGKYGIIDNNNNVLLPFTKRYIIAYSDRFERRKENSFETEILDCGLNIIENK